MQKRRKFTMQRSYLIFCEAEIKDSVWFLFSDSFLIFQGHEITSVYSFVPPSSFSESRAVFVWQWDKRLITPFSLIRQKLQIIKTVVLKFLKKMVTSFLNLGGIEPPTVAIYCGTACSIFQNHYCILRNKYSQLKKYFSQ